MKSEHSIRFGDTTIRYEVTRSHRRKKTIQTLVSADKVRVLAPVDTPDHRLEQLVRKQAGWILDKQEVFNSRPAPPQFVTGDTMPYLGKRVPLVVNTHDFSAPWIRLDGGRFLFDSPPGLNGRARRELIGDCFKTWYRDRAGEHLPDRVEFWLPMVACHADPEVLIRDQKRRWASCSSDGTLRFNWRTMMLDPKLIDYLVIHELAHLKHMNHSPDFWDWVGFFLPDMSERRRRLKEVEQTLPL